MTEPTITEFLLARIADDKAVALATMDGPHPNADKAGNWFVAAIPYEGIGVSALPVGEFGSSSPATEHMQRWSPARVLAECEAKRQVVESADLGIQYGGREGQDLGWYVLKLHALPHADHPDYREEWKP